MGHAASTDLAQCPGVAGRRNEDSGFSLESGGTTEKTTRSLLSAGFGTWLRKKIFDM